MSSSRSKIGIAKRRRLAGAGACLPQQIAAGEGVRNDACLHGRGFVILGFGERLHHHVRQTKLVESDFRWRRRVVVCARRFFVDQNKETSCRVACLWRAYRKQVENIIVLS